MLEQPYGIPASLAIDRRGGSNSGLGFLFLILSIIVLGLQRGGWSILSFRSYGEGEV